MVEKLMSVIIHQIKYLFIFFIILFSFNKNAIAKIYKLKIYDKETYHIIFSFSYPRPLVSQPIDRQKWDDTWKEMYRQSKEHCSMFNKNNYIFKAKKNGKWVWDSEVKDQLFAIKYKYRFICANNVKDGKYYFSKSVKGFYSEIRNYKNIEVAGYQGDRELISRTKVPTNHKDITQDEIIKKYFKGKKLENIEGIWLRKKGSSTESDSDDGTIIYIYKDSKNEFISRYYKVNYAKKGQIESKIEKISSKYFIAKAFNADTGAYFADTEYLYSKEGFFYETVKFKSGSKGDYKLFRIYPEYRSGSGSASGKTGASGSAFFIDQKGHLITNEHVVKGCEDNLSITYKNKNYKVKLISKDEIVDLAILKADISFNDYFELSDEQPQKLQRVIAAGYPLGKNIVSDDLKFNSGIISSLKGYNNNSNLIQIDAALNPGNSGGPVIDEETSKVVGVAVAGLSKAKTEGFNFAIKSSVVKNFVQSSGVDLPSSIFNFSFGTSREQLRKKIENSTLYIVCE